MPFKKPVFTLSSTNIFCSGLSSSTSQSHSHQSPSCQVSAARRRSNHAQEYCNRGYATIQGDGSVGLDHWPELGNPPRPPSPYQIFNQRRGEPYSKESKRRFYELVKLYHPDRSTVSKSAFNTSSCSQAIMLERYRMVITANAILSDPAKRDAYDKWGHGWSHNFPDGDTRSPYRYGTHHRWRPDSMGTYKWPVDQDPMYNATWEDWERWYRGQVARQRAASSSSKKSTWTDNFFSDGSRKQSPLFTNNYAFISIIFMLAALGGAGQATRVNEQAKSHLERTQLVNKQTSKVLMEARENTRGGEAGGETKDSRIRRFLRDTSGDDSDVDFDGRSLRAGDDGLCAPGLTKDRDQRRFWQKPPEN